MYKASHQHHHTSIITEAISGTSHPLLESVGYLANFSFPFLVPAWCGCFSFPLVYLYFTFFDVLNCIGHAGFGGIKRSDVRDMTCGVDFPLCAPAIPGYDAHLGYNGSNQLGCGADRCYRV